MAVDFGPLRSRASRKPWPDCPDIVIYRCNYCGRLYQGLDFDNPVAEPACCDATMERLKPLQLEDVEPKVSIDYKIIGGFNQSAVQVSWKAQQSETRPEWILLKTFTGSYLKYISSAKRPPAVFPLSDEDAYVYCNRPVCEECLFRCKRGFIVYVYFKSQELLEVPLERMTDYFKT